MASNLEMLFGADILPKKKSALDELYESAVTESHTPSEPKAPEDSRGKPEYKGWKPDISQEYSESHGDYRKPPTTLPPVAPEAPTDPNAVGIGKALKQEWLSEEGLKKIGLMSAAIPGVGVIGPLGVMNVQIQESKQLLDAVNRLDKFDYSKPDTEFFGGSTGGAFNKVMRSREQDEMILADFINKEAEKERRNYTLGGTVASGVSRSIPFMLQFVQSGGLKKIGSNAAQNIIKGAINKLPKAVLDKSPELAYKITADTAGWVGGSVAGGSVLLPNVASKVAESTTKQTMGIEPKEGMYSTVKREYLDSQIEYASEMFGGTIAARAIGKAAGATLGRLPFAKKINQIYEAMLNTPGGKIVKQTGAMHGLAEEYIEEPVGTGMRSVLGVRKEDENDPILQRIVNGVKQDIESFLPTILTLGTQQLLTGGVAAGINFARMEQVRRDAGKTARNQLKMDEPTTQAFVDASAKVAESTGTDREAAVVELNKVVYDDVKGKYDAVKEKVAPTPAPQPAQVPPTATTAESGATSVPTPTQATPPAETPVDTPASPPVDTQKQIDQYRSEAKAAMDPDLFQVWEFKYDQSLERGYAPDEAYKAASDAADERAKEPKPTQGTLFDNAPKSNLDTLFDQTVASQPEAPAREPGTLFVPAPKEEVEVIPPEPKGVPDAQEVQAQTEAPVESDEFDAGSIGQHVSEEPIKPGTRATVLGKVRKEIREHPLYKDRAGEGGEIAWQDWLLSHVGRISYRGKMPGELTDALELPEEERAIRKLAQSYFVPIEKRGDIVRRQGMGMDEVAEMMNSSIYHMNWSEGDIPGKIVEALRWTQNRTGKKVTKVTEYIYDADGKIERNKRTGEPRTRLKSYVTEPNLNPAVLAELRNTDPHLDYLIRLEEKLADGNFDTIGDVDRWTIDELGRRGAEPSDFIEDLLSYQNISEAKIEKIKDPVKRKDALKRAAILKVKRQKQKERDELFAKDLKNAGYTGITVELYEAAEDMKDLLPIKPDDDIPFDSRAGKIVGVYLKRDGKPVVAFFDGSDKYTAAHEFYHYAEDHLPDKKKRFLVKELGADPEARAEKWVGWRFRDEKPKNGLIKSIFEEISNFFRKMSNLLHGWGYRTWEDAFEDIRTGKDNKGQPTQRGPQYSVQSMSQEEANNFSSDMFKDKKGRAFPLWHFQRTDEDFDTFKIPAWFSKNKDYAQRNFQMFGQLQEPERLKPYYIHGNRILPISVYDITLNPWRGSIWMEKYPDLKGLLNPDETYVFEGGKTSTGVLQVPGVVDALAKKYDMIWGKEVGYSTYAVLRPENIRLAKQQGPQYSKRSYEPSEEEIFAAMNEIEASIQSKKRVRAKARIPKAADKQARITSPLYPASEISQTEVAVAGGHTPKTGNIPMPADTGTPPLDPDWTPTLKSGAPGTPVPPRPPVTKQSRPDDWYDANRHPDPIPLKNKLGRKYEDFLLGFNKIMTPISYRIDKQSPEMFRMTRGYIQNRMMWTTQLLERVVPYLKLTRQLNPNDKADLNMALMMGDTKKIAELNAKIPGATQAHADVREVFNELYQRATELGIEMNYQEEFWARVIKDQKGLMREFGMADRDVIKDALNDVEDQRRRVLSEEEQGQILTTLVFTGKIGKYLSRSTDPTKGRRLDVLPGNLIRHYHDYGTGLMLYIEQMVDKLSKREFFNRVDPTMNDLLRKKSATTTKLARLRSIKPKDKAAVVDVNKYNTRLIGLVKTLSEVNEKIRANATADPKDLLGMWFANLKIDEVQSRDLVEAVSALFVTKQASPLIKGFMNLTYVDTLASPVRALSQLQDLGISYYRSKYHAGVAFIKVLAGKDQGALRATIAKQIGSEYQTENLWSATRQALGLAGQGVMDRIGKRTLVETVLLKYQHEARKKKQSPDFWNRVARHVGPQDVAQAVQDFKSGEITDLVRTVMFGELCDVQPMSMLERPEWYIRHPNGRIFYMLRGVTLRQLNFAVKEAHELAKQGGFANHLKAFSRLLGLAFWVVLFGGTVGMIKAIFRGQEIKDVSPYFVDGLLQYLLIFNRYTPQRLQDEGVSGIAADAIVPPFQFWDAVVRDLYEDDPEKRGEITKAVPVFGDMYYWWMGAGARKQERKKNNGTF